MASGVDGCYILYIKYGRCEEDDIQLGINLCHHGCHGEAKPFLVLENMIVDKKYRNNRVGKALISELEKKASEKNCTQIILVTETNRIDACKFYDSVGYNPDSHKGYKKKLK